MRRGILAVAVVAVALPVVACGDDGGSSTPTSATATVTVSSAPAPSPDEVAWVDRLCGEIIELVGSQSTNPPDLQNPDTAQAVRGLDAYIGQNVGVIDQTITDLRGLGDSPVAGGDEALGALVDGLEALRTGYQATKDKLATVNENDPAAAQSAISDAMTGLSTSGTEFGQALESIDETGAIQNAGTQAPNCQRMNAVPSAQPPTT